MAISSSRRVLIVHAHPARASSRVNRALVIAARALPSVTVHDLYDEYPDFFVAPQTEQALLLAHDIIVLQHPFYWYAMPALLKEWVDLVLAHGWAYGPGGDRLVGRTWTHAISTGGPEEAYRRDGYNRYTVEEFVRPFEQTATLCGMRWRAPFVSHAGRGLAPDQLEHEAARYAGWLAALASGEVLA